MNIEKTKTITRTSIKNKW